MSPIDHFIETYHNKPSILELLSQMDNPCDESGKPRGLNRTTLAEISGVTYPVVHRTELALYERIPPKLLAFIVRHSHPYEDYPKMYKNYRGLVEAKLILKEKAKARVTSKHWTLEFPEEVISIPVLTFKDWRKRHFSSVMDMAKTILVNPTVIANYENGITKSLPVGLRTQFIKFGMTRNLLNQIAKLETPKEAVRNASETD